MIKEAFYIRGEVRFHDQKNNKKILSAINNISRSPNASHCNREEEVRKDLLIK